MCAEKTKRTKPRCVVFRIVSSILGIVSGISIFSTFLVYNNYHAATWGLISAFFASINAIMYLSYRKNKLHLHFTSEGMRIFKWMGRIGTIAALLAATAYFIVVVNRKEGYKLDGYMPAGIFALLSLKFTIMMIFGAKTFERYLENVFTEEFTTSS